MKFFDLIRSVEKTLYEIILWIVLIPKTIYKVMRYPSAVPAYIKDELAKEEEDRFSGTMSPMIFWMLLVIIPAYLFIKHFGVSLPAEAVKNREGYLYYLGLTFAGLLITPAIIINLFDSKKIERDTLRETIYTQCYLQAPACFITGLIFGLMKYIGYDFNAMNGDNYEYFSNPGNGWKDILLILATVPLFYLAYIEYKILKQPGRSRGRVLSILALSALLFMFVMLATAGLGYVLFFGM